MKGPFHPPTRPCHCGLGLLLGLQLLCLPGGLRGQEGRPALPRIQSVTMGFSTGTLYDVDERDARAMSEIWLESVVRIINQGAGQARCTTVVLRDTAEVADALRGQTVDLLIAGPLEFLSLKERFPLEPLICVATQGSVAYDYALLVHRNAGISSLSALRGRRLIVEVGITRGVSRLWLDTVLLRHRLPESEAFFGSITEVSKTSRAVVPVFLGQADACLVPLRGYTVAVELNPQLGESLVPLDRSQGLCRGLVCARKEYYDRYQDLSDVVVRAINTQTEGRQLLTLFRADEVVLFSPDYFSGVLALRQEYRALRENHRDRGRKQSIKPLRGAPGHGR